MCRSWPGLLLDKFLFRLQAGWALLVYYEYTGYGFCRFVLARQQVLNSSFLEEFCGVLYQLVRLALDDSGFLYFNYFFL